MSLKFLNTDLFNQMPWKRGGKKQKNQSKTSPQWQIKFWEAIL